MSVSRQLWGSNHDHQGHRQGEHCSVEIETRAINTIHLFHTVIPFICGRLASGFRFCCSRDPYCLSLNSTGTPHKPYNPNRNPTLKRLREVFRDFRTNIRRSVFFRVFRVFRGSSFSFLAA